ncbi:hypothetical protein, partial [Streptomyces albidoflavus]|uniref:hypothetical protein n=1 Tax=Streptomyces albidoflavus TaxID=1886 RepID=UPI003D9EF9BD
MGAQQHEGRTERVHATRFSAMTSQKLSFPRQHARTQRFTLGAPRAFTVSPDGTRVIFLRSGSGTDRTNR